MTFRGRTRRRGLRVGVELHVRGDVLDAEALDVGTGGMRIETLAKLELDKELWARIIIPGLQPVKAQVKVLREDDPRDERNVYGLTFSNLGANDLSTIFEVLTSREWSRKA